MMILFMTSFLVDVKRLVRKPRYPVRANREALASHLYLVEMKAKTRHWRVKIDIHASPRFIQTEPHLKSFRSLLLDSSLNPFPMKSAARFRKIFLHQLSRRPL